MTGPAPSPPRRVVVIGGGIAGLAVAYELETLSRRMATEPARRDAEGSGPRALPAAVTVLESAPGPGGRLRTRREHGFVVEEGPNGFLDNVPHTLDLARRLGLGDRLLPARPAAARRFLWRRGALRELPLSPSAFLRSPLLSRRGRLRVLCEPLAKGPPPGDESVFAFAARRIGREAARVLVDAMVTGVFAGDPHALSLAATFPRMAAMEREYGSLVRALVARRRAARAAAREARPEGAEGCSHGWSVEAAQPPDAQPVDRGHERGHRPEGAEDRGADSAGGLHRPSGAVPATNDPSHGFRSGAKRPPSTRGDIPPPLRGEETAAALRAGPAGPGGWLHSFPDGIAELPAALAARLAEVRTGVEVTAISRSAFRVPSRGDVCVAPTDPHLAPPARPAPRWRVELRGAPPLDADHVVLACPAAAAARLLAPLVPAAATLLRTIPSAPVAVVALAYERATIGPPLDGFGFLVPAVEERDLLGCLWTSSLYDHRAPAGAALLRVMVGGARAGPRGAAGGCADRLGAPRVAPDDGDRGRPDSHLGVPP